MPWHPCDVTVSPEVGGALITACWMGELETDLLPCHYLSLAWHNQAGACNHHNGTVPVPVNSLVPGRSECDFENVIFSRVLKSFILRSSYDRVPTHPYFLEKSLTFELGSSGTGKVISFNNFCKKGPGKALIFCRLVYECLIVRYYYRVSLVSNLCAWITMFLQIFIKMAKIIQFNGMGFLNSCEGQIWVIYFQHIWVKY